MSARTLSFLVVVVQHATLVCVIRFSKIRQRDSSTSTAYLSSVVIFLAELFKMILNGAIEVARINSITLHLPARRNLNSLCKTKTFNLVIPALLYLFQNNLLFFALSKLSVPVYQITNQGKLVTTAFISRIMLKKEITITQYLAIFILSVGVAMVHISEYQLNSGGTTDTFPGKNMKHHAENQWLGLAAVFASCLTSGFAGVYFEFVLKSTSQSVYCRNFQLAFFSFIFSGIYTLWKDFHRILEKGFFQGFDWLVVLIVVMQGMTGFAVGMIIKYGDVVLKGFATSVAVIVATLVSYFFFDASLNGMFLCGASMVVLAVKLYSFPGEGRMDLSPISKFIIGRKYHILLLLAVTLSRNLQRRPGKLDGTPVSILVR